MCRMKMVPVFSTDDTHKLDNNNECYETVHLNETELDKKSSFLKNDLFNIKVNMDSIDNNCPKMLNWEFYTYIFFMIYSAICSLLFLSFTFSNINTLSCLVESSTDTSNEIAYKKTILMIYQVTLTLYEIFVLIRQYIKGQNFSLSKNKLKYKNWLKNMNFVFLFFVGVVSAIIYLMKNYNIYHHVSIGKFISMTHSSSSKPLITISDNSKESHGSVSIQEVLQNCPILNEKYIAPLLWGKNGHIQTGAYGILGHPELQRTYNERCFVVLEDKTTVVYDIFEPISKSSHEKNITLALCPGIANNSESNYIRTCVHYAQQHGYRIAVLNHLGSLKDVELTSNRIFCYGGTKELKAMMYDLFKKYPESKFINIGFSMGGNITTRWIGKLTEEVSGKIICGMSINQGYCAVKSSILFHDWENGRRLYNYIITEKVKQILWKHYDKAVAPHVKSGLIDESKIWAASSNVILDEQYHRRVYGFKSVDDFYEWCGSINSIPNIKIPMVFVNAEDDPIVPEQLYSLVQNICRRKNNLAHVLTKHGGHLGFLEGKSLKPNSVTWIDRFIVQYADAAVAAYYSQY
uniref:AB hydrolase-1 domain-containing protein n=1 Tax=Strongyloides stercoralis TaxID=6248 RepID=A0A0K0ENN7_STRER